MENKTGWLVIFLLIVLSVIVGILIWEIFPPKPIDDIPKPEKIPSIQKMSPPRIDPKMPSPSMPKKPAVPAPPEKKEVKKQKMKREDLRELSYIELVELAKKASGPDELAILLAEIHSRIEYERPKNMNRQEYFSKIQEMANAEFEISRIAQKMLRGDRFALLDFYKNLQAHASLADFARDFMNKEGIRTTLEASVLLGKMSSYGSETGQIAEDIVRQFLPLANTPKDVSQILESFPGTITGLGEPLPEIQRQMAEKAISLSRDPEDLLRNMPPRIAPSVLRAVCHAVLQKWGSTKKLQDYIRSFNNTDATLIYLKELGEYMEKHKQ